MTVIQVASNFSNSSPDTVELVYTAPSDKAIVIEAFTAANTSGVNAAYSCYIQESGGILQPQVQDKVVVWGLNDLGIGIAGQVIPPDGTIRVEATAASSIYFTITGREIAQ